MTDIAAYSMRCLLIPNCGHNSQVDRKIMQEKSVFDEKISEYAIED